jgi:hypothetical protein
VAANVPCVVTAVVFEATRTNAAPRFRYRVATTFPPSGGGVTLPRNLTDLRVFASTTVVFVAARDAGGEAGGGSTGGGGGETGGGGSSTGGGGGATGGGGGEGGAGGGGGGGGGAGGAGGGGGGGGSVAVEGTVNVCVPVNRPVVDPPSTAATRQ